jgi:hypothetical protein
MPSALAFRSTSTFQRARKKRTETKKHKDAMAHLSDRTAKNPSMAHHHFKTYSFVYEFRSKRSNAIKIIKPVAHVRSIV